MSPIAGSACVNKQSRAEYSIVHDKFLRWNCQVLLLGMRNTVARITHTSAPSLLAPPRGAVACTRLRGSRALRMMKEEIGPTRSPRARLPHLHESQSPADCHARLPLR